MAIAVSESFGGQTYTGTIDSDMLDNGATRLGQSLGNLTRAGRGLRTTIPGYGDVTLTPAQVRALYNRHNNSTSSNGRIALLASMIGGNAETATRVARVILANIDTLNARGSVARVAQPVDLVFQAGSPSGRLVGTLSSPPPASPMPPPPASSAPIASVSPPNAEPELGATPAPLPVSEDTCEAPQSLMCTPGPSPTPTPGADSGALTCEAPATPAFSIASVSSSERAAPVLTYSAPGTLRIPSIAPPTDAPVLDVPFFTRTTAPVTPDVARTRSRLLQLADALPNETPLGETTINFRGAAFTLSPSQVEQLQNIETQVANASPAQLQSLATQVNEVLQLDLL